MQPLRDTRQTKHYFTSPRGSGYTDARWSGPLFNAQFGVSLATDSCIFARQLLCSNQERPLYPPRASLFLARITQKSAKTYAIYFSQKLSDALFVSITGLELGGGQRQCSRTVEGPYGEGMIFPSAFSPSKSITLQKSWVFNLRLIIPYLAFWKRSSLYLCASYRSSISVYRLSRPFEVRNTTRDTRLSIRIMSGTFGCLTTSRAGRLTETKTLDPRMNLRLIENAWHYGLPRPMSR